jgi:hypothetical protein
MSHLISIRMYQAIVELTARLTLWHKRRKKHRKIVVKGLQVGRSVMRDERSKQRTAQRKPRRSRDAIRLD